MEDLREFNSFKHILHTNYTYYINFFICMVNFDKFIKFNILSNSFLNYTID